MGREHGEATRDLIQQMLSELYAIVFAGLQDGPLHMRNRAWCLDWAKSHIPFLQAFDPALLEEAEGIAEGAALPLEEIIFLNGFLGVFDYVSPTFQAQRGLARGCTAFGVCDETQTLIGQTYDLEAFHQAGALLLRLHPEDAPECLVYTTAGMVGCAGMNAEGIGVVINNLIPNDAQAGVPYPFLIRGLLKARHVGQAIDSVLGARRASGTNYVLADGQGFGAMLETSATDYALLPFHRDPRAHANHYLAPNMLSYEARSIAARGNSIFRHNRMDALLHWAHGGIDREQAKAFLSDHANYPLSICHHHEPENKTICGIVIDPREREMMVSDGNPCTHPFITYEL